MFFLLVCIKYVIIVPKVHGMEIFKVIFVKFGQYYMAFLSLAVSPVLKSFYSEI
jgi:hypothetical protein